MVFKFFRINVLIRIVIICITISTFFYGFFNSKNLAIMILSIIVTIYLVYSLIQYVEWTNRKIADFLQSMAYSDFSETFRTHLKGRAFEELNKAFDEVVTKIRSTRVQKEEQYRYLQTVVQNIGIGLIIFREDGTIDLINNQAKRLVGIRRAREMDHIREVNPGLNEQLLKRKSGERFLHNLIRDDQSYTYLIYLTDFIQNDCRFRLAVIQNIQSELEEQEMEAWQNLIRILTHEIMNSVTPIISLASTANSILEKNTEHLRQQDCAQWMPDIREAIVTIEQRSAGLLQFVENYRMLTHVPKPDFELIKIKDLLERIIPLFKNEKPEFGKFIHISIDPESLELTADRALIEQVLINLIKNAVEAVENTADPEIRVIAELNDIGRPIIRVTDNGPGIAQHAIPNIFIPFFTTKANGSGIGLSLARQIMRAHSGSLNVSSKPGESTVFTLVF